MKYVRFFTKISLLLAYVGSMLLSCEKSPEMSFSTKNIIFEACPDEELTFDILSNVNWIITVLPNDAWLTVDPKQGKGNVTISLKAEENQQFTERAVFLAITGEGVNADTIKVIQTSAIDVADVIEDEIFKIYCLREFDNSPKDGKLSLKEAKNALKISVRSLNISSLAGIEYFTNITELYCSSNDIKGLDLSKNKELKKLDCSNNPVNEIDVSDLVNLTELFIDGMELQTVNLSKNTKLYWLSVSNNQLKTIELGNNKDLEILECNENLLTSLDLSKNLKLSGVFCVDNQLTVLDISKNLSLMNLWCNNNQLVTLDISQNKELRRLSCAKNSLTGLNLSNNTALIQLMCDVNRIETLNVSKNTNLTDLRCTSNKLAGSIDIRNNNLLKYLYLQNNPLLNEIWVWQGFNTKYENYQKDEAAKYIEK